MRHLVILVFLMMTVIFLRPVSAATPVFINEFHYDNTGGDTDEFVEIAGPSGKGITGWQIVLYNGFDGMVYNTQTLSGVIPGQAGETGTIAVDYPANGIQNEMDGIALVDNTGTVVQFLSYEGSFNASNGPANAMTSTDIGVSENAATPSGHSLQLAGTGSVYEDFTWSAPAVATPDSANNGQIFPKPVIARISGIVSGSTSAVSAVATISGDDITHYICRIDGGLWSGEIPVITPVTLSNLSLGSHSLSVLGKNSGGCWQDTSSPTTVVWTVTLPPPPLPVVITREPFDIRATGAISGGTVIYPEGSNALLLVRGITWDILPHPVLSRSPHMEDGNAAGDFSGGITGLIPKTVYYVRAWIEYKVGAITYTRYGEEYRFTTPVLLHTVTLNKDAGGTLSGEPRQIIADGADTAAVEARPEPGFYFTGWRGDYSGMGNPLVISGVERDMNISAGFAPVLYTIIFVNTGNGSLSGTTWQQVGPDENCTAVTAVPADGYRFAGWSGDYSGTENPLNVSGITGDMFITAAFEKDIAPGDINEDRIVDLKDAISVLKIAAGISEKTAVSIAADVNHDGRIGLEEAIYILRKIAGSEEK